MRRLRLVCCLATLPIAAAGCTGKWGGDAADPWRGIEAGWTKLPAPPVLREQATPVWTGSELLLWGGCVAWADWCRAPVDEGFAFDPEAGRWRTLPPAPRPRAAVTAVWTGREAIFIDFGVEGRTTQPPVRPQAFDPAENSWRVLPRAPLSLEYPGIGDWFGVQVWTGSELILWGGGTPKGPASKQGAAYDPATNTWRRIAEAPLGLNRASGVWTGEEMVAFGSLLDKNNHAATPTPVGSAYDPETDRWRLLPSSRLSPQASSVAMVGAKMLAWDYELRSQLYNPETDAWEPPQPIPLDFSECGPDGAPLPDHVFASFCYQAALYDTPSSGWRRIVDGPLAMGARTGRDGISGPVWAIGALESAGPVATLVMSRYGDAFAGCEACPRTQLSLWAFRP